MIYGNFWAEDQVIVAHVYNGDLVPQCIYRRGEGTPAFLAGVHDPDTNALIKYVFVEIVPGTEKQEQFLNADTGMYEDALCVDVNVFRGSTFRFEDMVMLHTDSWPLKWFQLDVVPPVPFDHNKAYERAMAVVGK